MPSSTVRRLCAAAAILATAGTTITLLSSTSAGADPSATVWDRLRSCESSGNYQSVDSSDAHFGAYQFDQATWNSVGGQGRPDQNSAAEQDYRALYLYRMRGWQPWECADTAHLNLQNDGNARIGRAPSYAESARIHAGGSSPSTAVEPPKRPAPAKPTPVAMAVRPAPAPPVAAAPTQQAAPVSPAPVSPLADILPPVGYGSIQEPVLPIVTLVPGTCSPVLANWQIQMNRYGYGLDGHGCYDAKTSSAARQLQYVNGIHETETIGPYTLAAAYVGRAPR